MGLKHLIENHLLNTSAYGNLSSECYWSLDHVDICGRTLSCTTVVEAALLWL